MQKKQRLFLSSFLVLAALLVSTISAGFAFAKGQSLNGAHASPPISAKAATAKLVAMHTVNMHSTPAESPKSASHHRCQPVRLCAAQGGGGPREECPGFDVWQRTHPFQQ